MIAGGEGSHRGGPLARLRLARRRVALLAAPESPHARAVTLGGLVVLTAVITVLTTSVGVGAAPALSLVVPIVLGAFLLERPPLQVLLAIVALAVVAELIVVGWSELRAGSVVVLVIVAVIAVELARDRERLGLSVGRGDAMLIELRDQLEHQGDLPALPAGWAADVARRSAGGSSFGGDFLVSTLTHGGSRLEVAIVDVSGKGLDAGTRALLLSGALGGLLGAVPPDEFLTAANDYLLRQEWDEGFATAVHATIDLGTGRYRLMSAGHPPAAHFAGGSGRWSLVDLDGLVLGVHPRPQFGASDGVLERSDALLLYTDGLVEVPGRDLAVGIDRLLGAAERLLPRGFDGGARHLVETVGNEAGDDRAVVLLWRT